MAVDHIVQACLTYATLRTEHWLELEDMAVNLKLYGLTKDLQQTAAFIQETGLAL
jgi:hypothetical protein